METKPELGQSLKEKEKEDLAAVAEENNSKRSRVSTFNDDSHISNKDIPGIGDDDSGFIPQHKYKGSAEARTTIAEKGSEGKKIGDKRGTVVLEVSDKKKSVTINGSIKKGSVEKKNSVFEIVPAPAKDQSLDMPGKLAAKKLSTSEFNLKRAELGHMEYLLYQTYRFYMIILILSVIFAIGSALGIIIISLVPPFDVALIPLSIYMGFISVILSIIISAKKRHNVNNHFFAWRFLLYCIAGNVIVLIYLINKVINLYPDGTHSTETFVFASGYLILYLLIEVIMLLFLYPESKKIQDQMELRESLIEELYNNLVST